MRCSRAIEPWWARTRSSPARSLSWPLSRSARRRELTKTIVERCARISSRRRGVDRRPDAPSRRARGRRVAAALGAAVEVGHVVDRHLDGQLHGLAHAGVDDDHVAPVPPRKRATSLSGRWVADRPMRCGSVSVSAQSRSRLRARWRRNERRNDNMALSGGDLLSLGVVFEEELAKCDRRLRRELKSCRFQRHLVRVRDGSGSGREWITFNRRRSVSAWGLVSGSGSLRLGLSKQYRTNQDDDECAHHTERCHPQT